MPTHLTEILDGVELARSSPYWSGRHSRVLDAVMEERDHAAAGRLGAHADLVARALADQKTTDNPGLLGLSPINAALVAAEAPVLAALASSLPLGAGHYQVAGQVAFSAVLDPVEKLPPWPVVDGSAVVPSHSHMAAAGVNVSHQVEDWSSGAVDVDAALSSSVLAKLEAALLTDLAADGTTATDLDAALGACSPPADLVVTDTASMVSVGTALAPLAQAGIGLRVIATPNYAGTLVFARAAIVLATSEVQVKRLEEPSALGIAVAAWVHGVASVTSAKPSAAVQVVATT